MSSLKRSHRDARTYALVFAAFVLGVTAGCGDPTRVRTGPPASIAKVVGDSQAVLVSQQVPVTPSVIVKDAQGNVLAGIPVSFFITQGSGTLGQPTANTTAGGTATPGTWTMGALPGQNWLVASVDGVNDAAIFFALAAAPASQMAASNGLTFSGPPSREMRLPTFLTNATNGPVQNAAVRFAVASGSGTLSSTYVVSDAAGSASARFTPGATPGPSVVNATLVGATSGGSPLVFTVNTYAGLVFTAVSPMSMSANTGTTTELIVRVRDGSAQPVADVPVSFSVGSGAGQFGSATAYTTKTNTAGEARASWTLPQTDGTHAATAEAFGQSVTFTATASTPPYILAFAGDSQFTAAGDFPIFNLEARGISGGFIVANLPITFSVVDGGGLLRTVVPVNSNYTYGQTLVISSVGFADATAQFRAGPTAGLNRIVVSAQGYAPDTFTVTGTRLADCTGIASMNPTDTIATSLESSDCPGFFNSRTFRWYTKPYRMTLPTTTLLRVSLTMPSGGPGASLIAMNADHYLGHSTASTQAGFRILAPAGAVYLGASTNTVNRTGPYTIASAALVPSPIRRGDYLMRGVDFNTSIDGALVETSPPFRAAGGKLYLVGGVPVTIEARSTAFDAYIAIRDVERTNSTSQEYAVLATDDNGGGGTNARLVFTATRSGLYEVWIGTARNTDPTGAYRLIIQ